MKFAKIALLCAFTAFGASFASAAETAPAPRPAGTAAPCFVAGGFTGETVRYLPNNRAVPVAATVVVRDKRGVVFARVRTDLKGRFKVDVPPGTYNVEVIPDSIFLATARTKVKATDKYPHISVSW